MGKEVEVRPEDGLSLRYFAEDEKGSILQAVLAASEDGVLLTDLEGQILACNRRFGEIFGVSPQELALTNDQGPRPRARNVIGEGGEWLAALEKAYADPTYVLSDEVGRSAPRAILRRHSAPIRDAHGAVFGRLWTFRDITSERQMETMNRILEQVSVIQDPDPNVVCNRVLELISEFYDHTTAILSIRVEGTLEFKGIVGPKSGLTRAAGNEVTDSFCQFAMRSVRPLLIQNVKREPQYQKYLPARVGFTRYLGVPVMAETSEPIGTLCILDSKSGDPLDKHDMRFLTMMAMRIAVELARERHIRERLAEKDIQLHRQRHDLATTHSVLESMNAAFAFLNGSPTTTDLLRQQTTLLTGLMDYEGAAILVRRKGESKYQGFLAPVGSKKVVPASMELGDLPTSDGIFVNSETKLAQKMHAPVIFVKMRAGEQTGDILLVLGRKDQPNLDERHRVHVDAIADQVSLLLSIQVLQTDLRETSEELSQAHGEILQNEKLSVVGTLAASTAHDIRNITASLTLLASPGMGSPDQALVAVREQLARFDVLAHRLLSYAKPRMVARQPMKIRKVLDTVLELTAAQLRIARVSVERKIGSSLPDYYGDHHQIEQVLVNLILNSAQAMDATGGVLKIEVALKGDALRLKIIDSGPGIPRETLPKLFEPFATTRANGFGLGLYSCKRIVEEHGGTISAFRNPIRGSTFTILLPIGDQPSTPVY